MEDCSFAFHGESLARLVEISRIREALEAFETGYPVAVYDGAEHMLRIDMEKIRRKALHLESA